MKDPATAQGEISLDRVQLALRYHQGTRVADDDSGFIQRMRSPRAWSSSPAAAASIAIRSRYSRIAATIFTGIAVVVSARPPSRSAGRLPGRKLSGRP
jgi:hypothetical protein